MHRTLLLSVAFFSITLLCDGQSAHARILSRGNPGSHFNVHGITYGSMKWERQQGNRRPLLQRGRRVFFRRR